MIREEEAPRAHEYELGHSDRELKRLRRQSELVDPFTRQFFRDAGIGQGMKVLDVGSGAGDTALLVAELVGDAGEVVGIDRAPLALAAAQDRIDGLGKRNISFRQADLGAIAMPETFDAIVGRYVLMFNPNPAAILHALARHLRPSGVIVFHEVDWNGARSNPVAPLYEQCCEWIVRTFKTLGTNPHMGQDLHSAFVSAGLAPPSMVVRALIGGRSDAISGAELVAELTLTMAPVMEEQGVVARGEIDPASFTRQVCAEVERLDSVIVGRSEIGAWSRLP
jgi:SAM-dependent methyltransferase